MKPIEFKEQTKTLHRPASMSDRQCSFLPVYSNGKWCLSRWKLSLIERLQVLIYGKIWVYVHSGGTQPPIGLECYRRAFEKPKEERDE